eukprot:CAMPEP_0203950564 /NCGR_PEP_ID=MMETSP0359-20131031/84664_1 /ASSEMBLY_ACC=CAM_ASM_000338 /TAXON_ID=268821 /ORGANISM="Scrippsiella Hangoei, Strain SHTV-5" /LENGTH=112 /DNA_ID=CAMNT_0050882833 /DNA_START=373 /DNA_END=711 /DNA_ORIENTATION=-
MDRQSSNSSTSAPLVVIISQSLHTRSSPRGFPGSKLPLSLLNCITCCRRCSAKPAPHKVQFRTSETLVLTGLSPPHPQPHRRLSRSPELQTHLTPLCRASHNVSRPLSQDIV